MSVLWEKGVVDIGALEGCNIKYDFRNMEWYFKVYLDGWRRWEWHKRGTLKVTNRGIEMKGFTSSGYRPCARKAQEAYAEYILLEGE